MNIFLLLFTRKTGSGAYLRVNHLPSLHLLLLEPFHQVYHSVHNTGPRNIKSVGRVVQTNCRCKKPIEEVHLRIVGIETSKVLAKTLKIQVYQTY